MEEAYGRVLSCLLLQDIIAYLPYSAQLCMRLVNKDWEDAARPVLKRNRLHRIDILNDKRLLDFLVEFDDESRPMQLLALAKVVVNIGAYAPKRLKKFATLHGQNVTCIRLLIWPFSDQLNVFAHHIKVMLSHFVNLEKLYIRSIKLAETRETDLVFHNYWQTESVVNLASEVIVLPQFERFRKLSMTVSSSTVTLLNDIIDKIPARTLACIKIEQTQNAVIGTNPFKELELLHLRQLNLHIRVNDVTVLSHLTELKLCSICNLIVVLWFVNGTEEMSPEFKTCAEAVLAKAELIRVQSLSIEAIQNSTKCELNFPRHMSHVTKLTLAGDLSITSSTNFQRLRTLEYHCAQYPLHSRIVCPTVDELLVGTNFPSSNRNALVALSDSEQWAIKFQNLTILHVAIRLGTERILTTIFATLVNLVELKLTSRSNHDFDWSVSTAPNPQLYWDLFTGGIPLMNTQTPIGVLIPNTYAARTQAQGSSSTSAHTQSNSTTHSDENNDDVAQLELPSIGNLRNLKILELDGAPTCIYYAVLHLSDVGKIPRLQKLKFSINGWEMNMVSYLYYHRIFKRLHCTVSFPFYRSYY